MAGGYSVSSKQILSTQQPYYFSSKIGMFFCYNLRIKTKQKKQDLLIPPYIMCRYIVVVCAFETQRNFFKSLLFLLLNFIANGQIIIWENILLSRQIELRAFSHQKEKEIQNKNPWNKLRLLISISQNRIPNHVISIIPVIDFIANYWTTKIKTKQKWNMILPQFFFYKKKFKKREKINKKNGLLARHLAHFFFIYFIEHLNHEGRAIKHLQWNGNGNRSLCTQSRPAIA